MKNEELKSILVPLTIITVLVILIISVVCIAIHFEKKRQEKIKSALYDLIHNIKVDNDRKAPKVECISGFKAVIIDGETFYYGYKNSFDEIKSIPCERKEDEQ